MSAAERFEWVVAPGEARTRLDRFLSTREGLGTRSQIQHLIRDGQVRVAGRVAKAATLLRAGQVVIVERPPAALPSVEPEAIPLDVLYEDDTVLVINKPPGLVVHPAPGHWHGTVVNALLHRWHAGTGISAGALPRLGIVHRLDKDTSGVLVIAKTVAALEHLARQFREREISKQYLALVWGRMARAKGVIREPIARHRVHRKRMAVQSQGRHAVTRYEVVERFSDMTLVRAYPETGRTHQIRVHMAAIGHPIVADAEYGGRRRTSLPIRRQALHAEVITFIHPVHGDAVRITAPLAEDWSAVLVALGKTLYQTYLTSTHPLSSVERQCSPRKGA